MSKVHFFVGFLLAQILSTVVGRVNRLPRITIKQIKRVAQGSFQRFSVVKLFKRKIDFQLFSDFLENKDFRLFHKLAYKSMISLPFTVYILTSQFRIKPALTLEIKRIKKKTQGLLISFTGFSMISRCLERVLTEHKGMKISLDSQLQIGCICFIRIRSRNWNIVRNGCS